MNARFAKYLALLSLALFARFAACQTVAYCNITAIDTQQLSNGVQITVKADGALELQQSYDYTAGTRVELLFLNAKSLVNRSFIDVSKYPVSYIQLAVPQTAKEGVGVDMVVALFEASTVSVQKSNDQQSVIITVNSNRTLVAKAGGAAGGGRTTAGMDVKVKDGKVSIAATKADLRTLLAHLAHKAGVSAAVDDSVKERKVSMVFADLPVEEALAAIASASIALRASRLSVSAAIVGDLSISCFHQYSPGPVITAPTVYDAEKASGITTIFLFQSVPKIIAASTSVCKCRRTPPAATA